MTLDVENLNRPTFRDAGSTVLTEKREEICVAKKQLALNAGVAAVRGIVDDDDGKKRERRYSLGAQRESGRGYARRKVKSLDDFLPELLVDYVDEAAPSYHQVVQLVQVQYGFRHYWQSVYRCAWKIEEKKIVIRLYYTIEILRFFAQLSFDFYQLNKIFLKKKNIS